MNQNMEKSRFSVCGGWTTRVGSSSKNAASADTFDGKDSIQAESTATKLNVQRGNAVSSNQASSRETTSAALTEAKSKFREAKTNGCEATHNKVRAKQEEHHRMSTNTTIQSEAIIIPEDFSRSGLSTLECTVHLSQEGFIPEGGNCRVFHTCEDLTYEPFCDDFGPMNFLTITRFVEILDREISLSDFHPRKVVYCAGSGPRNFTNAAFLLGAYMILKLDLSPEDIWARFRGFDGSRFEGYRDATHTLATFRLSLLDCWMGLARGRANGWVATPASETPCIWGQIDLNKYDQYEDPLEGDLHMVVPGKFVAFRGPRDINDGEAKFIDVYEMGQFYTREFSPKYYLDIFHKLGVTDVLRLNEACYSADAFSNRKLIHHDLYFEDCTAPTVDVIKNFFDIVKTARGVVAVHCTAGLGRTGTLIALEMMKTYGFTAREAIGWLRIMRPGSVIGEQQQFLCSTEDMFKLLLDYGAEVKDKNILLAAVHLTVAGSWMTQSLADLNCCTPKTPVTPHTLPRSAADRRLLRPGKQTSAAPSMIPFLPALSVNLPPISRKTSLSSRQSVSPLAARAALLRSDSAISRSFSWGDEREQCSSREELNRLHLNSSSNRLDQFLSRNQSETAARNAAQVSIAIHRRTAALVLKGVKVLPSGKADSAVPREIYSHHTFKR